MLINHWRPFRHDRVSLSLTILHSRLRALLNPIHKRLFLLLNLLNFTAFTVHIAIINGLSLMLLRRLPF